ncbi:hypothetical protein ABH966_004824 [Lysinibacillus sp. RC46]|uniref:hypothetical protein n=1 Tax=Lysinibacillus sp. RC46 TaxID=3156295 RepID=UPI003517705D
MISVPTGRFPGSLTVALALLSVTSMTFRRSDDFIRRSSSSFRHLDGLPSL